MVFQGVDGRRKPDIQPKRERAIHRQGAALDDRFCVIDEASQPHLIWVVAGHPARKPRCNFKGRSLPVRHLEEGGHRSRSFSTGSRPLAPSSRRPQPGGPCPRLDLMRHEACSTPVKSAATPTSPTSAAVASAGTTANTITAPTTCASRRAPVARAGAVAGAFSPCREYRQKVALPMQSGSRGQCPLLHPFTDKREGLALPVIEVAA